MVLTILFFIGFGTIIYFISKYSKSLSTREFRNEKNRDFELLMEEFKNIDQMKFDVVPANIMYSKTLSIVLKVISYLLGIVFVSSMLDMIISLKFDLNNLAGFLSTVGIFMAISAVFCILPAASGMWKYTYFQYGFSHQLKNRQVIFDFVNNFAKRIIKLYPPIFILSFIIGKITIGVGTCGVMIGTGLYEIFLILYLSLEEKRLGFAPIFNVLIEKLKSTQKTISH